MSIWCHDDTSRQVTFSESEWDECRCPFCKKQITELPAHNEGEHLYSGFRSRSVSVCGACGWWRAEERTQASGDRSGTMDYARRGIVGTLKNLDVTDVSVAVTEVRAFLLAKYDARFMVHPKLMEETVGSVFRDHGYNVRVTGRSGDDGIDAILHKENKLIGVQVKRYKNTIECCQIRSLAGALILNGLTKGMFVTTSSFQSGAHSTARRFAELGYSIELVDAERFYGELMIAQRTLYRSRKEFDAVHRLPWLFPIVLSEGTCERPL